MESKYEKNARLPSENQESKFNGEETNCKFVYDCNTKAFNINDLSEYNKFSRESFIPIVKLQKLIDYLNESIAASPVLGLGSADLTFDHRSMVYAKISGLFLLAFAVLVITDVYYLEEPILTVAGTACFTAALIIQLAIMLFNADFRSKKAKGIQPPSEQINELRNIVREFICEKARSLKRYSIDVTLSNNAFELMFRVRINT